MTALVPYEGRLSPSSRVGLLQTLKRLNWEHGRGDITTLSVAGKRLRVRLQSGTADYGFRLFRDAQRRLWVRFRGRTRIVRLIAYSYEVVA